MMDMMGGMALVALVGLVILAATVGVAVYLGVRAAHQRAFRARGPRDVLQERLAAGELSVDEYHERDSALRDAESSSGRRH